MINRACRALSVRAVACCTAAMLLGGVLAATPLAAQRVAPIGVQTPQTAPDTIADSLKGPPISPRRAMLYSLLLPGYAQSRLNRPTASILFAVGEVLSIGMARKAALDLREARQAPTDSIPVGFSADTLTGVVTATGYTRNRLVARVGARRTHYEDWLAAIIFNHIIAAADAYVAANLWDFNANIAVAPTHNGAAVGASLEF
jgi:hypothetical protein